MVNVLLKVRKLRRLNKHTECINFLSPLFEQALNKNLIDADVVRSLAEAFQQSGQFLHGQQTYFKAIKADPKNTTLIGRYCEYIAFSGNVPKALQLVEKALDKAPCDDNLTVSKGIILHRYAKDLDRAAAFLQNHINFKSEKNCNPDLFKEFRAVMHKIEKRQKPSSNNRGGIWNTISTRQAISTQDAISVGYSGLVKK